MGRGGVEAAGAGLEEDDERHEGEDHPELSGVATEDLLDLVHAVRPSVWWC